MAAAQPIATYTVPCQSRAEFSSRLRSLLAEPARAEDVLARFTIEIAAGSDGTWTLTVSEPANPRRESRTLRQATCTELVEAAALVVAAWADDAPAPTTTEPRPVAAPQQSPPVPQAAAAAPQQPTDGPEDARMRVGVSLRAEAAVAMMPTASFGGSAAVWFLTADRINLTSIGVIAWPSHSDADADFLGRKEYARPVWYLFLEQTQYFFEFQPVWLGLFGQLGIGSRRADEGGTSETTFGGAMGVDVRGAFTDWFAVRAQIGVYLLLDAQRRPSIATLSIDLTLN